jgi:hypothetical protein
MMTLIPFLPNPSGSPPFQAFFTLDGNSVTGSVTWNFAAQRWYLTLTDLSGNVLWSGAMVGSPLDFDIPLATGIFQTSTILYRADTGNFEVSP